MFFSIFCLFWVSQITCQLSSSNKQTLIQTEHPSVAQRGWWWGWDERTFDWKKISLMENYRKTTLLPRSLATRKGTFHRLSPTTKLVSFQQMACWIRMEYKQDWRKAFICIASWASSNELGATSSGNYKQHTETSPLWIFMDSFRYHSFYFHRICISLSVVVFIFCQPVRQSPIHSSPSAKQTNGMYSRKFFSFQFVVELSSFSVSLSITLSIINYKKPKVFWLDDGAFCRRLVNSSSWLRALSIFVFIRLFGESPKNK